MKFLSFLFKSKTASKPASDLHGIKPDEHRVLQLESEIAGLKLTIENLNLIIENQRELLANTEKNSECLIAEIMDSRFLHVFGGLASPLAQLSLLRVLALEGKEIKTENIFKLVSVIETALQDLDMEAVHQTNQTYPFDAESMNPVKPRLSFLPDENVLVRLPGYSYKGKIISKSLVDKIL